MRIYSCHTPSHARLFKDYFLRSLPSSLESHSSRIDIDGDDGFESTSFIQAIEAKICLTLASIEDNLGSTIIWSDVDIVFVRDPLPAIAEMLERAPAIDIWFQREHRAPKRGVNVGFVVMRCTDAVREFFGEVGAVRYSPGCSDQSTINDLLRAGARISWDYLPAQFYARSHGWPPPAQVILYHANGTTGADNIRQKIRQFADFRRCQTYGRPYLKYVRFRNKLKKASSRVLRQPVAG